MQIFSSELSVSNNRSIEVLNVDRLFEIRDGAIFTYPASTGSEGRDAGPAEG